MSRSYKKFPSAKSERSCKKAKMYANRKVRRSKQDLTNGNCYRRLSERWNIYEYKSHQTEQEAIDKWEKDQKEIANGINLWKKRYNATKEKAMINWYKWYKMK